MARRPAQKLVIGVGNDQRGDDAVGLYVARRLHAQRLPSVSVIECASDLIALMDLWEGAHTVCLVDAVAAAGRGGRLFRFDALTPIPGPAQFRCSSHGFGIRETVELARTLERLPRRLLVYGIEGVNFRLGAPLSREVKDGANKALAALLEDLEVRRVKTSRR